MLKKKIIEFFKDKKLYIFLGITLLFFGMFVKMDFATDTYAVIGNDKAEILSNFLRSGRFITAFFFSIFKALPINVVVVYRISYIVAIISITLSMYKLYKLIENKIKPDCLSIVISVLLIINPFSIEEMMYIEKGIMTMAILLVVLAVEQFVKWLENKNKKNIIYSLLLMILSMMAYQGVAGLFVIITAVFIIANSKNFKEFIKYTFFSLLIYGVSAIIDLLLIKILATSSRVDGGIILSETLQKIGEGSQSMFKTYNILPAKAFIIFNIITMVLIVVSAIKNKSIKAIIGMVYIVIVDYVFGILPQAMQNSSSIWFVARSTYPFASMLGAIILGYELVMNRKNEEDSLSKNTEKLTSIKELGGVVTIMVISASFLLLELARFYVIEINHYTVNYLDKEISKEIGREIQEYENQTGNKVTKISIYKDKNPRYSYDDIFVSGDMNITAFSTDWSDVNAINYYNDFNLEKVENDEEIKQEFLEEDYQSWTKEEIKFVDDTIHLCVF